MEEIIHIILPVMSKFLNSRDIINMFKTFNKSIMNESLSIILKRHTNINKNEKSEKLKIIIQN